MQPVLPTSLDMVSANVLGFDAQAYINDTPSTLSNRLNIPNNNYLPNDQFSKEKTAHKRNKKNFDFGAALAGGLSAFGLSALFFTIFKKKANFSNLSGASTVNIKTSLSSISNTISNICKNTLSTANKTALTILDGIKSTAGKFTSLIKKNPK